MLLSVGDQRCRHFGLSRVGLLVLRIPSAKWQHFAMSVSDRLAVTSVAQLVVRAMYPLDAVATIRRGPLKGQRIVVRRGMGLSYIWHLDGDGLKWLCFVPPGSAVYDIGANFGQAALHIARAVGSQGQVVSFEPVSESFRTLQRNIELNNLRQVTPVEAAVADRSGGGWLERYRGAPDGMGRLAASPSSGAAHDAVRLVALDDYEKMGWPRPDILKIDVEGGAHSVIDGADHVLTSVRPLIYIELHSPDEHDAVGVLQERYGYAIKNMAGAEIAQPRTAYQCGPLLCFPS
jgi:FkbM family methyltransferase